VRPGDHCPEGTLRVHCLAGGSSARSGSAGIRPCPEAGTHVFTTVMARVSRTLYLGLPLFLSVAPLLVENAGATSLAPFLVLTGEADRDAFGWAVAGVGDVNGDGYDDLLIGAPGLQARAGKVYVYFGGPNVDSIPDVVLLDDKDFSFGFGSSVAAVGDVNGDGRPDFVVGEPDLDRVLLFFGGATIHPHPDVLLSPQYLTHEIFGWSVASAGDLNGDGYGDMLIGSPGYIDNAVGSQPGRAYVVYGGVSPAGTPGAVIESPTPSRVNDSVGFGYSGSIVGDVNGDGKPDLAIAQGVDLSSPYPTGATFLYLGGKAVGSAPEARLESRFEGFRSLPIGNPQSVVGAGDLNGDGYDDFLVQGGRWQPAPQGAGQFNQGGVFVYFGGPRVDEIPGHRLFLPNDAPFDCAIAGGKDVNGDGYPDIVVGTGHGALVYFGGPSLDSIPNVVLPEIVRGSQFGESVSEGDINGDGVADVIVGAWGPVSLTSPSPGHVYVYDLSVPLRARAFTQDGHRTIPLTDGPSQIQIQCEPVNEDYQNADVDLSSLRLTSTGTGAVSDIPAAVPKRTVESDTDQDGSPELTASFNRPDLARLFSSVRGRHTIEVALEGRLQRGRKFRAPLSLTVLGTGKPEGTAPSLSPNPLNPQGTLTFSLGVPGSVTVRLYDLGGRSVRTVIAAEQFPAGVHQIIIDGRDERGTELASGVYFYRVETPEGASTGRFVVLK